MNEKEFIEACENVDRKAVSDEVLKWLVEMVNDYVDNSDVAYQIYFVGNTLDLLPQMGALKKLYEEGEKQPTEAEEIRCIDAFETVISDITGLLKEDKDKLKELFDKLIFFYDTKLMTDGKNIVPVTEELDGYVDITNFLFDPIPMRVQVRKKMVVVDKEGNKLGNVEDQEETVKDVVIDPGFCVQFELVYWKAGAGGQSVSML